MKIIKLNLENSLEIEYVPFLKYQNHIYMIKRNCEYMAEIINENKLDSEIEGFYKYNFLNHTLDRFETSKKIMHYFFSNDYSIIYYVSIDKKNNDYYAIFYRLNSETGLEEELFSFKLQSKVDSDSNKGNCIKIRYHDIRNQINSFTLNNNYILFIVDKINEYDLGYNHLSLENEFKMFIYDIKENKTYEVLDKEFSKHSFEEIKTLKLNGKEYVLFNSSIYNEMDKENCLYQNEMLDSNVRGMKDGIYSIELEKFISEIKQGCTRLSYKTIESYGENASVKLIDIYKNIIYYFIVHFDKKFSEFVMYDIEQNRYRKKKISLPHHNIYVTTNGELGLISAKHSKKIIELSGESWNIQKQTNIPPVIKGVLRSNHIISKEFKLVDKNYINSTIINDLYENDSPLIIEGSCYIINQEDVVIIRSKY